MKSNYNIIFKTLFFKLKKEEILNFKLKHLILGLLGTWVVGMGRYWDDPNASLLQHTGLGSVIYIFVLSYFIWLIVYPFRLKEWNYLRILTFISLTSFPAIFYAIPVEKFWSIETANSLNALFLAIVAIWRLALLQWFLKVYTQLNRLTVFTLTYMPICAIIAALTFLNVHQVVFNVMGGLRQPTAHDSSYFILIILTGLSVIIIWPLLAIYGYQIYIRQRIRKKNIN